MDKVDFAVSSFKEGFNCSQSVFSTYSKQFDINHETALKIAHPLEEGWLEWGKHAEL